MADLKYLKNVVTLQYCPCNCIGCGMCVNLCPHGVFEVSEGKARVVDKDGCMECGACRENCPVDAIKVKSGVGCVSGVIKGVIRGTEPTCDCGSGSGC